MNPARLLERFRELQAYVGWTDVDAERVRALLPIVRPQVDRVIDDFYATIDLHADARKVISEGPAQVERLKERLREWLEQLLDGPIDEAYVTRRWRVGMRHVEIGLRQEFAMAALARVRSGLARIARAGWTGPSEDLEASLDSLHRAIDLDLVLINDAYQFEFLQKQQRTDRLVAIGQMASGIAHELRNPLNVIRTSVFYLQNAKQASEEKRREHLERVERQVTLADGVISALSDFARLPLPDFQSVSVPGLLEETLDAGPLPENVQVERRWDGFPLCVQGDRRQLYIVFGNLIRNAIESMAGGGRLTLSAARVGEQVEVTVSDTGAGIPAEVLARVFEPFYSTKVRGIGLGLAITRAIVENHRGRLTVTSSTGQGSSFVVRLAAAECAASPFEDDKR